MRNIAIIALLLACVSVAGNAGSRKKFDLMKQENMKMKDKAEIYLAGGCFWGTEHFLKQIRGVEQTEVGYANSQVPNPTYKEVCTGNTGAVETVKVVYDPRTVDLDLLLDLYFQTIDPTSVNRQGGEPAFEKLDAALAKAMFSIGAVKGFEIGSGMEAARSTGLQNNDAYGITPQGDIVKKTNHSGGITGGISDGCPIIFRAAFKPTPSIASPQETVNRQGEAIEVRIKGRHDPIIVPRAVVVVESMAALVILDAMLGSMTTRLDKIKDFFQN